MKEMYYRTDDPFADFDRWSEDLERCLHRRPKCDICHEHIQDDYGFRIQGELICERCLNKHFKEDIED